MTLRIVGGTDAGDPEAPPVWEDKANGVRRMLRAAMEAGLVRGVIVGADADGDVYVASTASSSEETIGFLMRGVDLLQRLPALPEEEEEGA